LNKQIQALNNSNKFISDRSIKKLTRFLKIDSILELKLRNYFLSKGIPDSKCDFVFDHLITNYITLTDINSILAKKKSLSSLPKHQIIQLDSVLKNFDTLFLTELINCKWSGSPAIGGSEILFTLLFNDTYKPNIGDLKVKDTLYEIKCNSSRLSQVHSTSGEDTINYMYRSLLRLQKKFEIKIIKETSPRIDTCIYNFTKKHFYYLKMLKLLYADLPSSSRYLVICRDVIKTFLQFYPEFMTSNLYHFLILNLEVELGESYITDTFIKGFQYALVEDSFNSYISEHNINGEIIYVNSLDLKCLFVNVKSFKDFLYGDYFQVTMPSFSIKAGSQGSSVGLKLL